MRNEMCAGEVARQIGLDNFATDGSKRAEAQFAANGIPQAPKPSAHGTAIDRDALYPYVTSAYPGEPASSSKAPRSLAADTRPA